MSKTCIITGASHGIGRAIAIALCDRDNITNFILISTTNSGLEETAKQMNREKNITYFALDLTQYGEVNQLIHAVGEEYGTIDMLINVAGYANPKSLMETSIEEWEKTYQVNVHSLFNITKETVKFMKMVEY